MMKTEDYMLNRFGPLMSLGDVADILGRSSDAVRMAVNNSNTDISKRLKPAMVRIGRRIYFKTLLVLDLVDPIDNRVDSSK